MKGLMFNLLETMAADAGCSDEAWELVIEFAASDGIPGSGQPERKVLEDAQPSRVFEIPAEAMLRCLSREGGPEPVGPQWDLFEMAALSEHLDQETFLEVGGNYGAADLRGPYCGGVGAFVETDDRSERLDLAFSDLDAEGNPTLDEVYRLFGLGPLKQ